MTTFTDKANREWDLVLDIPLIRAAQKLGVDFLNLKTDPISKLEMDPMFLVELLWLMCRPQAEEAQITQDNFEAQFGGAEFDDALAAIKEAIVIYHPTTKQQMVREILSHNEQIQRDADSMIPDKLKAEHPRIMAAVGKVIDERLKSVLSDLETV